MKIIKESNFNWGILLVGTFGVSFWVCIWKFGLFQTIMWYILICALIGIVIKLKENNY